MGWDWGATVTFGVIFVSLVASFVALSVAIIRVSRID